MHLLREIVRIRLLGIVLICGASLFAQTEQTDAFESAQPLLMDSSKAQLNFYDFGYNPAGLFDDQSRKSLQIRQYANFNSGGYRLPSDAAQSRDQHFLVRTVQPLTENDLFKGYFAYHRKFDQKILFADQSENLDKNPYIFADSSMGDFTLNGLYWAGEWAHRFNRHWQSGLMFFYNVDQRLKNVFPKPLNNHRNIHFQYGLQYKFKSWAAGLTYAYFDDQEKIAIKKYNLDQDLTPIILKFRFSDLPVIERGKTSEERKISNYGHRFGLQLKKEFKQTTVMANYSQLARSVDIIDGGSQNICEGNSESVNELLQLQIQYLQNNWQARLSYNFNRNTFSAWHPDFDLLIWQAPDQRHKFQTGLKFNYMQRLPLYLDIGYAWRTENRSDRMTQNFWRYQNRQISGRTGFAYSFSKILQGAGWLGVKRTTVISAQRSSEAYSVYYDYLFKDPFTFYTQNTWLNQAGLKLIYHYGPVLDMELYFNYANLEAKKLRREQLVFGFEIMMYIF